LSRILPANAFVIYAGVIHLDISIAMGYNSDITKKSLYRDFVKNTPVLINILTFGRAGIAQT